MNSNQSRTESAPSSEPEPGLDQRCQNAAYAIRQAILAELPSLEPETPRVLQVPLDHYLHTETEVNYYRLHHALAPYQGGLPEVTSVITVLPNPARASVFLESDYYFEDDLPTSK